MEQSPEQGHIKTGRYEGVVTPSNLLGAAGVHFDNPVIGGVYDQDDDPADIAEALKSVGTVADRQVGLSGLTAREIRAREVFDDEEDCMRERFRAILAAGVPHTFAREAVILGYNVETAQKIYWERWRNLWE